MFPLKNLACKELRWAQEMAWCQKAASHYLRAKANQDPWYHMTSLRDSELPVSHCGLVMLYDVILLYLQEGNELTHCSLEIHIFTTDRQ